MKKKHNKIYWIAGIALLCCVSGVFAYWTQELNVHNEFKTARYDTNIEEEFVSPDNWCPGQEINKDVRINNKGTVPVFAKVVLQQKWIRTKNVIAPDGTIITPKAGEEFSLIFDSAVGNEYAAEILWGNSVVLLDSGRTSDIDLGIPIVSNIDDAYGKWLMITDKPDKAGNYTLYYIGIINQNEKTPLIIDAVTMNPHIQPAIVKKDIYFDSSSNTWILNSQRNSTYDYENAKYTLIITATTVQATEDAIKEIFGTESDNKEIVDYLAEHAVDPTELY